MGGALPVLVCICCMGLVIWLLLSWHRESFPLSNVIKAVQAHGNSNRLVNFGGALSTNKVFGTGCGMQTINRNEPHTSGSMEILATDFESNTIKTAKLRSAHRREPLMLDPD